MFGVAPTVSRGQVVTKVRLPIRGPGGSYPLPNLIHPCREPDMHPSLMAALIFTTITMFEQAAQKVERMPDKTVEITRKEGKLVFIEHGKEKAHAIPIVVGQTIRWENKDTQPHTLVSILTAAGKPLFDTGVIPPGKYKDVLFDIDMYERAGGKPANVVTVKYHSRAQIEDVGEIHFLSAARRGRGLR